MTITISPSVGTPSLASVRGFDMPQGNRITFESLSETRSTILVAITRQREPLRIADLGWSRAEAAALRAQLVAFEEDWDAAGMDAYDAL